MSELTVRFDPWGPISVVLYETKDSDFVEDAIATTGVEVDWRPFTREDAYSHSTRIRALRRLRSGRLTREGCTIGKPESGGPCFSDTTK